LRHKIKTAQDKKILCGFVLQEIIITI